MARSGKSVLVLVALGLAFGLAAGGGDANAGTNTREPNEPVDLPTDEATQRELAATVCQCALELANGGGAVTPASLRFCVADRWWPTTSFPPIPADPQSVKDAWAMVAAFALAYTDDPEGFAATYCAATGGFEAESKKLGDIMHEGSINISALCAPPIPQAVPIRVLFQGDNGFSSEAWAFDENEWDSLDFPGGAMRTWPTVAEAINGTRELVLEYAATFCEPDTPDPFVPDIVGPDTPQPPDLPAPTPAVPLFPVPWSRVPIPDLAQYPWEAPLIHEGSNGQHWPTPGMFFLVRDDAAPTDPILALDTLLGISRVALSSAYAMAGAARQLSEIPDAQVLAYLALIACSPWNDKAYGASNPAVVGGELGLGPHSRGVNMLPRHANNVGALAQGKAAKRTTTLTGGVDQTVDTPANSWPQLWLPPIRLDMLRDLGVVSTQGLEWSNGDSVIVPPPVVWNHNVSTTTSPPGGSWGC